jgi:hypothetical protein
MEVYVKKSSDAALIRKELRTTMTVNRMAHVRTGLETRAKELEKAGVVEIRYT